MFRFPGALEHLELELHSDQLEHHFPSTRVSCGKLEAGPLCLFWNRHSWALFAWTGLGLIGQQLLNQHNTTWVLEGPLLLPKLDVVIYLITRHTFLLALFTFTLR